FAAIQHAFLGGHDRFGMRLVDFSVQDDYILLVVEAEDERSLARAMQGLSVRIARAINRALGRRGKVFADRYQARTLETPVQVWAAVEYVRHHFELRELVAGRYVHPLYIGPYSSMSGRACALV